VQGVAVQENEWFSNAVSGTKIFVPDILNVGQTSCLSYKEFCQTRWLTNVFFIFRIRCNLRVMTDDINYHCTLYPKLIFPPLYIIIVTVILVTNFSKSNMQKV
jgi:hypothetical protein